MLWMPNPVYYDSLMMVVAMSTDPPGGSDYAIEKADFKVQIFAPYQIKYAIKSACYPAFEFWQKSKPRRFPSLFKYTFGSHNLSAKTSATI
jgi:hypothetical protein